ncbi:MAG TPA: 3'-5' exonuclease [Anaerolineales bacterium]|nr:3'-5' exonuclease [Anaerolineales bacterium]
MVTSIQARRMAILKAQEYLRARPLYLDTETTGLNPLDEIVEICIVDHDGKVLLNSLVRPTRPIPAEVIRVHGITNPMVAGAPAWSEVWPEVRAILSGRQVGIYNADFDLKMMQQSSRAHRLTLDQTGWDRFCLMKLYASYYGQVGYRGEFRWQRLEDAARQCQIKLLNTHRALDDTLLARALLEYMASQTP